jgi:type VI secretion system protein ImpK
MISDNPFSEPDDSDRTVFIPSPGGRRPTPAAPLSPAPSFAPEGGQAASVQGPSEIAVGSTPLLAAASPLLQLLGRLRNTAHAPDPGDLRERAAGELRRFERAGRDGGIPLDQLRPAHFALCAALDDVALSTPWGAQGSWASASLVSAFHQQVRSGAEFFALLKNLSQSPGTMLPVLELMYLCIALGFQGQYRLSPRGPAELDAVREELFGVIVRHHAAGEPGLSPHWQGLDAPYRPRRAELPIWVVAACFLALLAGLYAWASIGLGGASDTVVEHAQAAPPPRMPEIARSAPVSAPPPPVEPGALDRLRTFLKPEIDQHLVSIVGTEAVPDIRIAARSMFAPGSATLEAEPKPLLRRVGEALRTEPGPVTIAGYTDSQPIRTVKFPSNFQLSQARAEAAAAIIDAALAQPGRVTSEGRGAADPVDSNATAQGRERNRRIEVILRRQG